MTVTDLAMSGILIRPATLDDIRGLKLDGLLIGSKVEMKFDAPLDPP